MNWKKYICSLCLLLMMLSCHENYNLIYYPEEEVDKNVHSGDDADIKKVQIFPSLYDEKYGIYTRGSGPLDDWANDQKQWMETTFHAFAYRTRNYRGGTANYAAPEGTDQCLLRAQPLRMYNVAGEVAFYDEKNQEVKKFYHEDLLSRWKFFLLNTDKADDLRYEYSGNRVTAHFTIDGQQDVMHSFAYHTPEDLATFEKNVAALGTDNDAMRVFTDSESKHTGDLVYSGLGGSLGLHPKFTLNHLMSRFDVYVLGGPNSGNNFLQIVLDKVTIDGPDHVSVTVADDAWEKDSYQQLVKEGQLLATSGEDHRFPLDLVKRRMENNAETQRYNPTTDFALLWKDIVKAGIYADNAPIHHICSKNENFADTLARTIMLPPQQSYSLHIGGKFFVCHETAEGQLRLTTDKQKCYELENVPYRIALPSGEPFQPDGHYNIVIYVYGLNQIEVSVSIATPWKNGGTINVDTE